MWVLNTKVLYLPIGRLTFDVEAAENVRKESLQWLNSNCLKVITCEKIVTSVEELEEFLKSIHNQKIDSVIYQSVTFADGEFIEKVVSYFKEPVIVWSVREPSVGGRLRLNSLTGGNSTSNALNNYQHPFTFVFGNPNEEQFNQRMRQQMNIMRVIRLVSEARIGVVGDYPPGFFFSDANEEKLKETFGLTLQKLDLHQAFKHCVEIPEEEWMKEVEQAKKQVIGLNSNDETVKKFAQFTTYIKKQVDGENIISLAMRCWPDFFVELGAAPCSTLSHLTEGGMVTSCESDIHGSLSMYILRELSGGNAPYLGDWVHLDEEKNSAVFWHCGAGAYSLASPLTGAKVGVHPNRKIGFALDFGLKAGEVTLFRIGNTPKGYRLLIMKGTALNSPQAFNGTSVEVELATNVTDTLYDIMHAGYEPHYALIYGNVTKELIEYGRLLGLPTDVYI